MRINELLMQWPVTEILWKFFGSKEIATNLLSWISVDRLYNNNGFHLRMDA